MGDSIHTLQEFMFRTKGILYLLAISYLIGFVWFWKFLNGRQKNEED
jgi:hypothetical protein